MGMKTILILIGVTAGAGILIYTLTDTFAPATDTSEAPEAVVTDTTASTPENNFSGTGPLSALFGAGQSIICEFIHTSADVTSEGTLWYDQDKFAVESTSRIDGELYTTNLINDGARSYIWSGTAAGSMAISMSNENTDLDDNVHDFASGGPVEPFDPDDSVTYDCDRWTVNPLTFVPPSTLDFFDLDQFSAETFRGVPEGMDF